MTHINLIKNYFYTILITSLNIYSNISIKLRFLGINPEKNDSRKKQLKELFIYIGVFIGLIIIIFGGYTLYKRYIENKVLREIRNENENYIIIHNSISAPSQDERKIYSFNIKFYNNKYQGSEVGNYNIENDKNNSFDYNHEERMEKIRKKYGNKMLINILIKQQIETIIYNKNLGLEYGDNCTICVNNFIDNAEIYRTPCEHIFHKDCFYKYLKKINKKNKLICPNCNQNLLVNKKFLKHRKEAEEEKIQVKKLNINQKKGNLNKIEFADNDNIDNNNNIKNIVIEDDNTILNRENIIILRKRNKEKFKEDKYDNLISNKTNNIKNKLAKQTTMVNRNTNIYKPTDNIESGKKDKKYSQEDVLYIEESNHEKEVSKNSENIESQDIMNLKVNDTKKKFNKEKIKFSEIENNNMINIQFGELNSNGDFIFNKINFEHREDTKK